MCFVVQSLDFIKLNRAYIMVAEYSNIVYIFVCKNCMYVNLCLEPAP